MRGKRLLALGMAVFMMTALLTMQGMKQSSNGELQLTAADVGKMCLSGSLMVGSRGSQRQQVPDSQQGESQQEVDASKEAENGAADAAAAQEAPAEAPAVVDTQDADNPSPQTINVDNGKPLVIIYHTHATESYQPASDGNFHVIQEEGTVREVGNVLTAELQKKGIQVIHDKTIHDNPSYNQSYSRSLETINNLLAKYPGASVVIDLHRDAAGYSGGSGKTTIVNGETVAKYNLVVGKGNPNAEKLRIFGNTVNKKAEEMFPGYGGRIIDKEYKFNQYVSDYHMLLEIGNNENNIREADACAKYFADVLAEVIQENSN
ncbi:stage II sporulation protein P [Aminipila butyrica]|uniref:Stage II sporulation protein P n=1 Tax=Aminipila butyrica TaxID=433296 RepID=A0A858BXZ7_9FIRM|nr:stage II sporulation protein P [Aminipila butyrica]QIB69584.1 stage II sporulation protein P [Aminipila butyrica]